MITSRLKFKKDEMIPVGDDFGIKSETSLVVCVHVFLKE